MYPRFATWVAQLGAGGVEEAAKARLAGHGRLRWFGHLEHGSGDNWVSACRNVEVVGARCVSRTGVCV